MTGKCVLIVDDNLDVCRSLIGIFRKKGFEVNIATTGKDALRLIQEICCSVILIDRRLPDMRGTELLETIREHQPDAVKIMLTGTPMAGETVDVKALGLDAFLLKPANPQQLFSIIEGKLAQKQLG